MCFHECEGNRLYSVLEHRIELEDPTPFNVNTRPIPPAIPPGMCEEVHSHIAELLSAGAIEESPFISNFILVQKEENCTRVHCFQEVKYSHWQRYMYLQPS